MIHVNCRNYQAYRKYLEGVKGVQILNYDAREQTNYQYIILEIESEKTTLTRDQLIEILQDHNVRARRYFYPGCHQVNPYKTLYPEQLNRLPKTDSLCQRVLCLPTGQATSLDDINKICQIIKQAL